MIYGVNEDAQDYLKILLDKLDSNMTWDIIK